MEHTFEDFAALAASAIGKCWRTNQAKDQSESEPGGRVDESTEAAVRITALDGQTETSAHVTIADRPD